jgi:hypothetical protein
MQRLLSTSRPSEAEAQPAIAPDTLCKRTEGIIALSPAQVTTLREIQTTLASYSIEAKLPEVVEALMESLASRPMLCRGLVAAYLMEG